MRVDQAVETRCVSRVLVAFASQRQRLSTFGKNTSLNDTFDRCQQNMSSESNPLPSRVYAYIYVL